MVNLLRQQPGLAGYVEDHEMSDASLKHAYYIVKTNTVGHEEDHSSPHYTPEGEWAASPVDGSGGPSPETTEPFVFTAAELPVERAAHPVR